DRKSDDRGGGASLRPCGGYSHRRQLGRRARLAFSFPVSMTLLRLDSVALAYGHIPLLAHADFQIEAGERVCLVGRNGTGKSTLLRVITSAAIPDEGEVWRRDGLRIGHLDQEVPPDSDETVFQVVAGGLGELGLLLTEYHAAAQASGAA